MLAEFGDAPRAMRITCDQIGDDLLDAARTSAHMVSASSCCPQGTGNTYIEPEKGRQRYSSLTSLSIATLNIAQRAMRVGLPYPSRHLRAGAACPVSCGLSLWRDVRLSYRDDCRAAKPLPRHSPAALSNATYNCEACVRMLRARRTPNGSSRRASLR